MYSLNEFECWDGSNTECLVKKYIRKPQLPLFCSGVKDEKRHLSYKPLKQSMIWNACAIILTPDVLDQLTDKTCLTVSDIRQVYAAIWGQDRKQRQITTKGLVGPTTVPFWLTDSLTNLRMNVELRLPFRTSDLSDKTVCFFGQHGDLDHSQLCVPHTALCLDTDKLDYCSRQSRARALSIIKQICCTLGTLGRQQLLTPRCAEPAQPLMQKTNPFSYATNSTVGRKHRPLTTFHHYPPPLSVTTYLVIILANLHRHRIPRLILTDYDLQLRHVGDTHLHTAHLSRHPVLTSPNTDMSAVGILPLSRLLTAARTTTSDVCSLHHLAHVAAELRSCTDHLVIADDPLLRRGVIQSLHDSITIKHPDKNKKPPTHLCRPSNHDEMYPIPVQLLGTAIQSPRKNSPTLQRLPVKTGTTKRNARHPTYQGNETFPNKSALSSQAVTRDLRIKLLPQKSNPVLAMTDPRHIKADASVRKRQTNGDPRFTATPTPSPRYGSRAQQNKRWTSHPCTDRRKQQTH
ncbi:hypothetical protein H4582DRAFT_2146832 [Lactarius indigo]|nr:hypothetical protein H4582DRAFT_2146832 [Lactarius indigo]